jgi:predicted outer membrane protein
MKISWKIISIVLITASIYLISCGDDGSVAAGESDTTATTKEDAEDKNDSALTMKAAEKDAQFLVDVAASNYGEVKLAKLGQQRSSHKDLKEVAKLLEADHTAVLNELKRLASAKTITLPTEENAETKDKLRELGEDNASEFDKEWCEILMDSHKNSITRFENAVTDVSDADIKNFLNTVLPKLRTHHDKLMECHKKLR